MTGTARSLRDWLRDQLREIRRLTPLSVLAPADRSEVPTCQHRGALCEGPATVRTKAHLGNRNGFHGDCCVLLCDGCLDDLRLRARTVYRDAIPILLRGETPVCLEPGCGKTIRSVHDIIQVVTAL